MLIQRNNREPSPEEIGELVDMPAKKVEEILKLGQEPVSLEAPVGGEEGDASLGDFIEDDAGDRPLEIVANQIRDKDLMHGAGRPSLARAPRDRAALRPRRTRARSRSRTSATRSESPASACARSSRRPSSMLKSSGEAGRLAGTADVVEGS